MSLISFSTIEILVFITISKVTGRYIFNFLYISIFYLTLFLLLLNREYISKYLILIWYSIYYSRFSNTFTSRNTSNITNIYYNRLRIFLPVVKDIIFFNFSIELIIILSKYPI